MGIVVSSNARCHTLFVCCFCAKPLSEGDALLTFGRRHLV